MKKDKKFMIKEVLESEQYKEFLENVPLDQRKSVLEYTIGLCQKQQKILDMIQNLSDEEKLKIMKELTGVRDR